MNIKDTQQIDSLLDELLQSQEDECVEFKEAKNDFDSKKLGKYFSAISNEANLRGKEEGWLIFGVDDKTHSIIGTQYRNSPKSLNSVKGEIARGTTQQISFVEIYELIIEGKRVLLFQIPAAPKGIPMAFSGHYYARNAEELVPLDIEKIERIRKQYDSEDWSEQIVQEATIEDLDPKAIILARENYTNKFPHLAADVASWDDSTFLNKAKLTKKGKITRTALILLGKDEAAYLLNSAVRIRWKLIDRDNNDLDYEFFGIPMLLSVEKVFTKIRNLKYRYLQEGTIFPTEVTQYEPFSIREALNNCIAHQDYTKKAFINLIEGEDRLIFSNYGTFIPQSVEKVVLEDAPEEIYRNRFLVQAMFNLNMVDTVGGGIKKMFNYQRKRLFPMPEYDLSEGKVKMTLIGKILDMNYAQRLAQDEELILEESILLDKVQKRKELTTIEEKHLRKRHLIEGRKPNYFICKEISQKTGQKADYSKNKGLDKQYYLDFILNAIKDHSNMTRADIDKLLWEKLPDILTDVQKKNKINNLLAELKKQNKIKNIGTFKTSVWVLI